MQKKNLFKNVVLQYILGLPGVIYLPVCNFLIYFVICDSLRAYMIICDI